jgi:hypothetical protein
MDERKITGVTARLANAGELAPKVYYWHTLTVGDCTMFDGARWTLYPGGRASFDGVVTSSDDGDAWLMWAHFTDGNAELGMLENDHFDPTDHAKFVQNMPDHTQRYRFFATGTFNGSLFPLIGGMYLDYHC